jgi:S1-C subfamily serine protease
VNRLPGSILRNNCAHRACAREGDPIEAAKDQGVTSVGDLHRFLGEWPVHGSVALAIERGQDRLTVKVTTVEAE